MCRLISEERDENDLMHNGRKQTLIEDNEKSNKIEEKHEIRVQSG